MSAGLVSLLLLASCASESPSGVAPIPNRPSRELEVIRPLTLTDDARVPEQDSNLDTVHVTADELLFHYRKTPKPNFDVGNVIAGARGGGYLRRVAGVTVEGTTVTVRTEPAHLVDFIRDGAFRIRQAPAAEEWTSGDLATNSQAVKVSTRVSIYKNSPVTCAIGTDSFFVDPTIDLLDPGFEFFIDVSPNSDDGKGEIKEARSILELGTEASLKGQYKGSAVGTCSVDLAAVIAKAGGFEPKIRLPPKVFLIGKIPVVITHSLKPIMKLEGKASAASDRVEVNMAGRYSVRVGSEYRDGQWNGVWEPTSSGEVDVTVPPEQTTLSAQVGLSAGVEYSAYLYDLAGPKLGLEAGFTGKLSADLETCQWNASLQGDIRANASVSVQVPIVGLEVLKATATFTPLSATLGSASGDLPGLECTGAPPPPPADAGVDAPPPETPPAFVPPDATDWWQEEIKNTTSGSAGNHVSHSTGTVWTHLTGWSRRSEWIESGDNINTIQVLQEDCESGVKTLTGSKTGTLKDWSGNITPVSETYGPSKDPCGGIECPGYDYMPWPVPKAPKCTQDGIIGYDGVTYSSTKTVPGGTTLTKEYTCRSCGGKSAAGCACTSQGVECK